MELSDEAIQVLDYVLNSIAIYGDASRRLSDIQLETKLTDEQCRAAFGELHSEGLINLVPGPDSTWLCVPLMNNITVYMYQRKVEQN